MQNEKKDQGLPAEESKPRKKPGGRAAAPEKKAAAKARAEQKAKADNLKPEVFVQFYGSEIPIDPLVDAAKEDFQKAKKRALITSLKLYVKPEEYTAYYVINESFAGRIPF